MPWIGFDSYRGHPTIPCESLHTPRCQSHQIHTNKVHSLTMKFTAAVVAICAATASAFSVTMSSTGYLSDLGSGGGLTSFAPAAGGPAPSYSYAPVCLLRTLPLLPSDTEPTFFELFDGRHEPEKVSATTKCRLP